MLGGYPKDIHLLCTSLGDKSSKRLAVILRLSVILLDLISMHLSGGWPILKGFYGPGVGYLGFLPPSMVVPALRFRVLQLII